ncbi:hypothetical protein PAMA_003696 [Pampus argenteus]
MKIRLKTESLMDSSSEDGEYQTLGFQRDAAQYRVSYPDRRNTNQGDYDKYEEVNRKRYVMHDLYLHAFYRRVEQFIPSRFPVSRCGNNPARVKRVVSCKRKTHHLTGARKKQLGSGRNYDAANKENEMNCMQDMQQEIFDMDLWEFPLNVDKNDRTGRTGSEQTEQAHKGSPHNERRALRETSETESGLNIMAEKRWRAVDVLPEVIDSFLSQLT